ncbi:TlpA family protein disulfide reductase [Mucilaginibacter calamicampi]|uniref:TlpA family protein disulfide reductase n=1 Tax=Mucilaginibacter calamicampi TaxID=1302352 RepID=A0ABW2YTN8_9SPHI
MQAIKKLLLMVWAIPVFAGAQEIRPLKINDKLPEVAIAGGKIMPGELYRNGLLIINFWATWCAPCQVEMEKMARSIDSYNDQVQMLCVAYESEEVIAAYLKKHPELTHPKLKFIADDKYFQKLFFHQALPHNVWIDSKGMVKAITGGDDLNSKNIKAFLENPENTMYVKAEVPFDYLKPMHIPDSLLEFRSIFSRRIPGVELSGTVVSSSKFGRPHAKRFFGFNTRIVHLFWKAYQMPGLDDNPYLLEVRTRDRSRFYWPGAGIDPDKYKGISNEEWDRTHGFSYELTTPEPVADSLFFKHVISDLELNLKIRSFTEMQERRICEVTCTKDAPVLQPMPAPDDKYYLGVVKDQLVIKNISLDRLLDWIADRTYKRNVSPRNEPYVNTVKASNLITASIPLGDNEMLYTDQVHLEKCLGRQLGLSFQLKTGLYPVVILSDL